MSGNLGFSYIGFLFLLMLFIPNIMWSKRKPQGYTSEKENKVLLFFERLGEGMVCCCSLAFSDFNIHKWTPWSLWLIAAFVLMIMYEVWWIRYFRSERRFFIRLLQWFFWHTSCRGNPASHGIFYVGDIWKGAVDADSNTYLRDWACRNTHAAQKNYLTV